MAGQRGTHGGHANSGRKPKNQSQRILDGSATLDQRMIHAEDQRAHQSQNGDGSATDMSENAAGPPHEHVPRPSGLRADERKIWDLLAPLALAAHTLTPQTAVGFRTLVETRARRLRMYRLIDRQGLIVKAGPHKGKRHPLLVESRNLLQLETSAMLRFCLHAAGREMDFVAPVPAAGQPADRWAKFDTPPPAPSMADESESGFAH